MILLTVRRCWGANIETATELRHVGSMTDSTSVCGVLLETVRNVGDRKDYALDAPGRSSWPSTFCVRTLDSQKQYSEHELLRRD